MRRGCGIGESKVSWRNLFTVLIFFWRAGYDNDKISEDACPNLMGRAACLSSWLLAAIVGFAIDFSL
jgi:hypothetical protein